MNNRFEPSLGTEQGGLRAAVLRDKMLVGIEGSSVRDGTKPISARLEKALRVSC